MRVLYFLDSLNLGGSERQAVDVCKNAADYGIDVTVIAGEGQLLDELQGPGVDIYRMQRKLPVDLMVAASTRRVIHDKKIQIVHGYQAVEGLHLYLATIGMSSIKRILSFQGFIADAKNRRSLRFLIPRMDANLYVSEGLRKWIAETDRLDTNAKARVLYNGADPGRLTPSGRSIKEELGIPSSSKVIGMIANFYRDPRKDQLTLARALRSVFAVDRNSVCLFVGKAEPGAEEKVEQCRTLCSDAGISDRVFFLGGRNDVPDILAELDVFVFSSLQEGLPVALTEAMLAGVPCVVSDIEPHLEATDRGRTASVFPTGDADALAIKLAALLKDSELRYELSSKALEHASANFSIDAHMRGLKEIYAGLIDQAK